MFEYNLKELQDTFESAKTKITKNNEPVEELIKMNNVLKAVVENPSVINEKMDADFRKFFFDTMATGALKALTKEKSRDEKYMEVIANILENYTRLFLELLKRGQYVPVFFEAMKHAFEHDSILHNYGYQISEEELKRIRSANQEWRADLKEGDMIDALVDDTHCKISGWSQALIDSVNGDILHLAYIQDNKSCDKYLDRWSVEIAQFETKTKELFEWKSTIEVGTFIDCNDKTSWNKAHVMEIKEIEVTPTRKVKMAYVAFRIYQENGTKTDDKGQKFEGWSTRFDEWISIFSPRIMPYQTKTLKQFGDDQDLDDHFDHLMVPEEGHTRVYAVPRLRKCISRLFLKQINDFGNAGGFDVLLQAFAKSEGLVQELEQTQQQPLITDALFTNKMDINLLSIIITNISAPYQIYHKDFIAEYGPKFVDVCSRALKAAPEKSLRDVRRERIESVIKSIDNFQRRIVPKDEREKQTEVIKLEVCLMCLKSSFLERRIQGIRDLNLVIRNNRMFNSKTFTAKFLVEWMEDNGVFAQVFDPRKTHLQLVQRTADILKLLLQEDRLTREVLEQFWSLAATEYKFEIYKVINDVSLFLKEHHIAYIFEQFTHIPAEKMALEELQTLSELGKFSKDLDFKKRVSQFFWDIICNSDSGFKEELVANCITKFADMVKYWDMATKHEFFVLLQANIEEEKSSVSCLRLFKQLIKDQRDRVSYTTYTSTSGAAGEVSEELTLGKSLDVLIQTKNLKATLLGNLTKYCLRVKTLVNEGSAVDVSQRKKLNLVNPKYSHHDEIDERLSFIKYLALVSKHQVSKADLEALYDRLVISSPVPSDQDEFLTWCKSSCEESTAINPILDLNEVGEFFSEKMKNGSLDVKNLLVVGFDFLQQYFLSVNEQSQKLIKTQPAQKKTKQTTLNYGLNIYGGYGPVLPPKNQEKAAGSKLGIFKILKNPSELDKLEIVWNIALNCQNEEVVPKAIDFLIKVYYSLDADLHDASIEIQDQLIAKCMKILRDDHDPQVTVRVISILEHIMEEAERKGTSDVRPHHSLLKGELLDKIVIKNNASPNIQSLIVSIYSNATYWDFKKKVAEKLGLSPKYLKLQRADGKTIKDSDNGKTLSQLKFTTTEVITASKINIQEDIPQAPLVDAAGKLTERASKIFNEWFTLYSNENDKMTPETCSLFIKGCTGEHPPVTDDRIVNLFKTYDTNADGLIEREDFISFYTKASQGRAETVRENLRHHNVRADLKKLSEVKDEENFEAPDMPRFKISKNAEYFNILMSLLDHPKSIVAEQAWDLIQMLATNPQIYTQVLKLEGARDAATGEINWDKFFSTESQSVYRLRYTLQIIEAVMEEGEGEGLERVDILEETDTKKKPAGPVPNPPSLPGATVPLPPSISNNVAPSQPPDLMEDCFTDEEEETKEDKLQIIDDAEDKQLRSEWTTMFLKGNGFDYILKSFMTKEITAVQDSESKSQELKSQFELKHIAFLLKLLRIFITAAFSTNEAELAIYESVSLVRKCNNIQGAHEESDILEKTKTKSHLHQLQDLMMGTISEHIISKIDYKALLHKILTLISQVLSKREAMIFEDKLIVENTLSLMLGCILHKNDLLNEFYSIQQPLKSDEFVLSGLLQCPHERIREEFKSTFACLARKLTHIRQDIETPLSFLLRLLSGKFAMISDYPCKQFFELFCEIIDLHFIMNKIGDKASMVFDPETLLSQIIDKIKIYNRASQKEVGASSLKINVSEPLRGKVDSPLSTSVLSPAISEQQSKNLLTEDAESIYIGLLQLTGKIIDNFDIKMCERIVEQKSLIDEIFVNFLFKTVFDQGKKDELLEAKTQLKIKPKRLYGETDKGQSATEQGGLGKKSKDAAYRLLNNLIRKSPLLMHSFLEKSMLPLVKVIKRQDGWNYSPPGTLIEGGRQKYCGLKNLGAICYMNSMMQQFFMIPAFRYNLLSVDDNQPEHLVDFKNQKVDDNVLHQFQKAMAHLELSDRNDYNPFEFCFAFKDLDGNPTNTGEQKDAQEFLNLAFDRIETMLRNTSRKYLLQSVFGGQTCSQVVCLECGTCKNRIEDFYNMSLTVKDIKSLYDSLQTQVQGEVINGYDCEKCKKKVDISKRVLLSQTPNVLIVHLQRIIFNFDTFRNDKINTLFEFPTHLDLKPYSFYDVMGKENRLNTATNAGEENQGSANNGEEQKQQEQNEDSKMPEEDDCWEYKLVGVTVHSGTANAGHYWSYINTRRGHAEPNEDSSTWAATESDPWMEFNDSTVRNFNFDKLKEETFGEEKTGSGGMESGFGNFGSYGKSAYMLVYERKKKKPIKILTTAEDHKADPEHVLFDEKKNEYFRMSDYKTGVEEIYPSAIYQKVQDDNKKYEFDNDIYSNEFFEFVRQILVAASKHDLDNSEEREQSLKVKEKSLLVGKKTVMELLAKCYSNSQIKPLCEVMMDIMKQDVSLCHSFLDSCFKEDNCDYLMSVLLDCSDQTARVHVGNLVKFIVNQLKEREGQNIHKLETISTKSEKGEVIVVEQPASLVARFIMKCLSLFNTQVAKNWARFEQFFDILLVFGCGEENQEQQVQSTVGLEFLMRVKFVERAFDFILGSKSPLCLPGEKRVEMGSSFNPANFTPLIKLVTKIFTSEEITNKYPFSEIEQKMFLNSDVLKIMLSQSGGKQFGKQLANMCHENIKLSQKVSKVFIKSITSSNYESIKSYMVALKPFLKLNDSLKAQRLEWVFGVSQIVTKKQYQQERYKYGFEFVDRLNDEAYTYIGPITSATSSEEPLLGQLLKAKGRMDTFAINCLTELLGLMAKDEQIARFIYNAAPTTYQSARYTDWIRPYLNYQREESERNNSYNYFKGKYENILKSIKLYDIFVENFVAKFNQEEQNAINEAENDPKFSEDIQKDWLAYHHSEVLPHFPPQLIIGKQTQDDKEFLVYDEDPLVKVTVSEVTCEYNYSNPTDYFNLSIPHIEFKTNTYSTISYAQMKQNLFDVEKKQRIEALKEAQKQPAKDASDEETTADTTKEGEDKVEEPQQEKNDQPQVVESLIEAIKEIENEKLPPYEVRNWFETKREGAVLLKINVTNRYKKKVKVSVGFEVEEGQLVNVNLPKSMFKTRFHDDDTKCILHLQKIDLNKEWGSFKIKVISKELSLIPNPPALPNGSGKGMLPFSIIRSGYGLMAAPQNFVMLHPNIGSSATVNCSSCRHPNDQGQDFCDRCGDPLIFFEENINHEYYGA